VYAPRTSAATGNPFGLPDFTLFGVTLKPFHYILAMIVAYNFGSQGLLYIVLGFFAYRYYLQRNGGLAPAPAPGGAAPPPVTRTPSTGATLGGAPPVKRQPSQPRGGIHGLH